MTHYDSNDTEPDNARDPDPDLGNDRSHGELPQDNAQFLHEIDQRFKRLRKHDSFLEEPAAEVESPEIIQQHNLLRRLEKGGYTPRAIAAAKIATGPAIEKGKQIMHFLMEDGIILLFGDVGRGKTVLATWFAMQRQGHGLGCGAYTTAFDMLERHKAATFGRLETNDVYFPANNRKINPDSVIDWYEKTEFLVIDEVQNRGNSDQSDIVLESIIDARYGRALPTVLIANYNKDEIQSQLGNRILDRAKECGGMVNCDWPSYRTPKTSSK